MTTTEIEQYINEGKQLKGYNTEICAYLVENSMCIVILDDDPTGTQTVYDVPVVTEWSVEVLEEEVEKSPVFFILTNSRSLQEDVAVDLAILIGERLQNIAKKHQKKIVVISRSDSTLRGHYPAEVDALANGLGTPQAIQVFIPAFFEGGRYTVADIHYVKEGEKYIPASETPFAKDGTFGYSSSNLKAYISEKRNHTIQPDDILSISLERLRNTDSKNLSLLLKENKQKHIIVNAVSNADLEAFALAALQSGESYIYRTAASFVNAITGISPKAVLEKDIILKNQKNTGALIVIGSYVPKTTAQLTYLKEHFKATFLELKVADLLFDAQNTQLVNSLASTIDASIKNNETVVFYTSREVQTGTSKEENLRIVNKVSQTLTATVKALSTPPTYILAKGGITSSDIVVKALGTKKALVLGQALAGVPVWELDAQSKFPGIPYIVFPGNVGDESALYQLINRLS
ncbi:MAG: hypothetical protein NWQ38_14225 [Cellulophaga sp.]|nr:hypothetical protein [Cellulophaga sp.]